MSYESCILNTTRDRMRYVRVGSGNCFINRHFGIPNYPWFTASPVLNPRLVEILGIFILINGNVYSFEKYRQQIPNSDRVPNPCNVDVPWPGVGHQRSEGGGIRNKFGRDFWNSNRVWSAELCNSDSDGDGRTNGEELGDPLCVWKPGDKPQYTNGLSHPGICEPLENNTCRVKNGWLKCGNRTFDCPEVNEPDIHKLTLRYPVMSVPAIETNYYCMMFELPSDQPYHLVANEPFIDNEDVLHHMILFGCDESHGEIPFNSTPTACGMIYNERCNSIIGLWSSGYPGECFNKNAGMLFGSKGYKKVILQVHWNNPTLFPNYTDSSGLTIFYTPKLRRYNSGIFTVGQQFIEIFPGSVETITKGICSAECSRRHITAPVYITMAMNHMHYLGKSQRLELYRSGHKQTDLTYDEVYSYDEPVAYLFDDPIQMLPGDEVRTTCTYMSNTKDKYIYYGPATSDEMCFGFIRYYPAENIPRPWCVSYKDKPCHYYVQPYRETDCSKSALYNTTHGEWSTLYTLLARQCNVPNNCSRQCHVVVQEIRNHRCFQRGKVSDFIRAKLISNKQDSIILSAIENCDTCQTPECLCRRDRVCEVRSTGNSETMPPILMTLSILFLYSLFFKLNESLGV